ncbi:hypothetical protein EX895_001018 [Sporisorium graminicola]|uniref:Uncharacterized protein n=1 Tax=Sporisorium graminicola TaxID=280036 RepID=A0A4V6EUL0_9BASI|nr:hypothetical protein EX895_001018 [Sporisorium graminicola]TKY91019.1 hypothetical protein EX895_001018 [Sporisorium graminicola]
MTCPFAKFASILPIAPTKSPHSFHAVHALNTPIGSTNKVALTLSDALRVGTAQSHRAVEKSRGVSLLLQSVSAPTSSPTSTASSSSLEQEALSFDRLDYVRFNVMLACVYIALEGSMAAARDNRLLAPLFADAGLLGLLVRSRVLLDDVSAHLATIESHTGAGLAELAEQAREEHSFAADTAAVPEDVEDPTSRLQLLALVRASLPSAARLSPEWRGAELTEDHLALLHPAQVCATLSYVRRLTDLSRSPSSTGGLLLSHAYTRYLGDLSGGQHIVKKVSKRFPISTESAQGSGFAFYAFDTSTDLKARFRSAMEHASPADSHHPAVVQQLVGEANTAFDLNTALFESLLPASLRMGQQEEREHPDARAGPVQTGKAVEQAAANTWTAETVVALAAAVVFAVSTTVWIRNILSASAAAAGGHVHV